MMLLILSKRGLRQRPSPPKRTQRVDCTALLFIHSLRPLWQTKVDSVARPTYRQIIQIGPERAPPPPTSSQPVSRIWLWIWTWNLYSTGPIRSDLRPALAGSGRTRDVDSPGATCECGRLTAGLGERRGADVDRESGRVVRVGLGQVRSGRKTSQSV